jgi:hypothetical protein
MFNNSKENSADIVPFGQSILTKDDITNINNFVQSLLGKLFGVEPTMVYLVD